MSIEDFKIHHLSEQAGKSFLRALLATEKCVPFIGGGFTAGEPSYGGTVPTGRAFAEIMRSQIQSSSTTEKPSVESLSAYGFQKLADEYFREEIVELAEIKDTLRNLFTNVRITNESKKAFIRWDWEYLYTLNIDDAIEREIGAIKVLPFKEFSKHNASRFLLKLHGDAQDAITAISPQAMKLVFGSAHYLESLIENRAFISTLVNDISERHLIFVGCSLTDELDILYALAHKNGKAGDLSTRRVYVTADEPKDYESRKKMRNYGITDVLVVDYSDFYSFVGALQNSAARTPLDPYVYKDGAMGHGDPSRAFLRFLLQTSWRTHEDSGDLSVRRDEQKLIDQVVSEPIVVLWGRRSSGRTALLYSTLSRHADRKRYFISSSTIVSELVIAAILRLKDALIAIDTGAITYENLRYLVDNFDQIGNNNTTIIIATSRPLLSALGSIVTGTAIEVRDRMSVSESREINLRIDQHGLSRSWKFSVQNLDNIFSLSESPVVERMFSEQSRLHRNIERLHQGWRENSVGKLEFSVLFYLATRQRIYSRYFRELAIQEGLDHMANAHFSDFSKSWEPFVEREESDINARSTERSTQVIVVNSTAWIGYAIRKLSLRLGINESASQIIKTYQVMSKIENNAFELLLFDNLNSIFTDEKLGAQGVIIKNVYELLAPILAHNADYWLQRAKGIYYMSSNAEDLWVGVEYCEKSIVQRAARASVNAKLTKANLLGKICKVKAIVLDGDLIKAVEAYVEAIESREENPIYIDELLRKSQVGRGYMSFVCRMAGKRAALLPHKQDIDFLRAYSSGVATSKIGRR